MTVDRDAILANWGNCSVASCGKPWQARTLCDNHHHQAMRGTIPMPPTLTEVGLVKPRAACKLSWCDDPARTRGYCSAHYQRSLKGQHMGRPVRSYKPPDLCTIPNCGRPYGALGLCSAHYFRLRAGMSLAEPLRFHKPGRKCKVAGCSRPHAAKGYCSVHRERERKGLPIDTPIRDGLLTDRCDFTAAHVRVKAVWGPARQYPCIECGEAAKDWAYDGTDSTELLGVAAKGRSLMRYSLYPEFYMPMCRKCHHSRDKGRAAQELREYREFKHRTRMTLPEIEQLLSKILDAGDADIESAA